MGTPNEISESHSRRTTHCTDPIQNTGEETEAYGFGREVVEQAVRLIDFHHLHCPSIHATGCGGSRRRSGWCVLSQRFRGWCTNQHRDDWAAGVRFRCGSGLMRRSSPALKIR